MFCSPLALSRIYHLFICSFVYFLRLIYSNHISIISLLCCYTHIIYIYTYNISILLFLYVCIIYFIHHKYNISIRFLLDRVFVDSVNSNNSPIACISIPNIFLIDHFFSVSYGILRIILLICT